MTSDPLQQIRRFIRDRHDGPATFTDADDLIETGLIDSLQFADFVLLIAELSGRDIPLDAIDIEEFRTIDAVRRAYFPQVEAAPVP